MDTEMDNWAESEEKNVNKIKEIQIKNFKEPAFTSAATRIK